MQLQRQTKRFAKAMVDAIAPVLTKASPDEHRATNERIKSALLADPEPAPRNVRDLSRDEQFVLKAFRSFGADVPGSGVSQQARAAGREGLSP
jgi:hypothetical protein